MIFFPKLKLSIRFNSEGDCTISLEISLLRFLDKFSNRLAEVMLADIYGVNNNVFQMVGKMEKLEAVTMDLIWGITEEGIIYLADDAKALPFETRGLRKKNSTGTGSYIKRKIKEVRLVNCVY